MTYRVVFTAKADAETIGLPDEPFAALVNALGMVSRDPWTNSHPDDPSDPAFRWATFGDWGLVSFYLDDRNQAVRVHDVTWIG